MIKFVPMQNTKYVVLPHTKSLSLSLKILELDCLRLCLKVWDQTSKVSVSFSKFEIQIQSLSLSLKIWYQEGKVSVSKLDTIFQSLSPSINFWDWVH